MTAIKLNSLRILAKWLTLEITIRTKKKETSKKPTITKERLNAKRKTLCLKVRRKNIG